MIESTAEFSNGEASSCIVWLERRFWLRLEKRGAASLGTFVMNVSKNEEKLIDKIIEQNREILLRDKNDRLARAQHGRSHGCVRAKFVVRPNLPERFQYGLFQAPKDYSAVVRFSNGAQYRDDRKDAHGMAIKLFNVPGAKSLDRYREEIFGDTSKDTEHDFILADNDLFPSSEIVHYEELNRLVTNALQVLRMTTGVIKLDPIEMLKRTPAALKFKTSSFGKISEAFASQWMHSPLEAHYWSTQPFRLGPGQTVRYLARTKQFHKPDKPLNEGDTIGAKLRHDVQRGDSRFEFCIIEPPNLIGADVEDGTIRWACDNPKTDAADPEHKTVTPVADIYIQKDAEFDAFDGQGFEFSPWRTLDEHEPLGVINLIRLFAYLKLSKERFPNK